jgi:hypothetical protein
MEDIWKTVYLWCDTYSTAEKLLATCKTVRNSVTEEHVCFGQVARFMRRHPFSLENEHELSDRQSSAMMEQCLVHFTHIKRLNVMNYLIKRKVKISKFALYAVCLSGQIEMVKLMLEHGVFVDEIALLRSMKHKDVVAELLQHGVKGTPGRNVLSTPLLYTIYHGHREIEKLLLKYGAEIDYHQDLWLNREVHNEYLDLLTLVC